MDEVNDKYTESIRSASTAELRGILVQIDRSTYPNRYDAVKKELAFRKPAGSTQDPITLNAGHETKMIENRGSPIKVELGLVFSIWVVSMFLATAWVKLGSQGAGGRYYPLSWTEVHNSLPQVIAISLIIAASARIAVYFAMQKDK